MAWVRLTEQARGELDAIIEYYEHIGASAFAEILEAQVIEKIRRLERFPRLGRTVPEIGDEAIREVIYRDLLLSPTGTAPSGELVERFLGRPFNADAWRVWLNEQED